MIAALYALLFGGLAAALGGGGSGSGVTSAPVGATPDLGPSPEPIPSDPTPLAPAPVPAEVIVEAPEIVALDPAPAPIVAAPSAPAQPDGAYDIGWAGPSAEEQLIVELINRARLDPDSEIARLNEGLATGITPGPKEALAVVESLSIASREHSQDMDNRDFFAHQNPDGQSPGDRALEEGHGTRYTGENIGWIGSSRTSFDRQARAEDHHENLWRSDGHQRNLMNDNWTEIGVGYDYGDYRGLDGSTFVTEMFSDRGDTYLTGVVIEDRDGDAFYDMGEGQGAVRITATHADGRVFTTATWDAGGYTLELPPGTYSVTFEGGDLDAPYSTTVTIGDENVKLDVIDPGPGGGVAVSAGFVPSPVYAEADVIESDTLASLPLLPPSDMAVPADMDAPELELALL